MAVTMYAASVPVYVQMLDALAAMLVKAEAHARARRVAPAVILDARLYPDMFPLVRQVQLATDFAKGPAARLAGVAVPVFEDNEITFADLAARLARTIAFLASLQPAQFDGAQTRDVTVRVAGQPVTFAGEPYLLHFALPNFYFHVTIAYAILRHNGVDLGKRDFVGKVPGL